jgi:hypothetical protein
MAVSGLGTLLSFGETHERFAFRQCRVVGNGADLGIKLTPACSDEQLGFQIPVLDDPQR